MLMVVTVHMFKYLYYQNFTSNRRIMISAGRVGSSKATGVQLGTRSHSVEIDANLSTFRVIESE